MRDWNLNVISNKKYFITGGGFGLPAEVIKEKEKLTYFKKDYVYLYSVLKTFFKGYKGLNVNIGGTKKEDLMFI
jgi:hypothetical protein